MILLFRLSLLCLVIVFTGCGRHFPQKAIPCPAYAAKADTDSLTTWLFKEGSFSIAVPSAFVLSHKIDSTDQNTLALFDTTTYKAEGMSISIHILEVERAPRQETQKNIRFEAKVMNQMWDVYDKGRAMVDSNLVYWFMAKEEVPLYMHNYFEFHENPGGHEYDFVLAICTFSTVAPRAEYCKYLPYLRTLKYAE